MLELYKQNRVPPSQGSEVEGSAGGTSHRVPAKHPSRSEEKQISSQSTTNYSSVNNHGMPSRTAQNQSNDNRNEEIGCVITDHKMDIKTKDIQHPNELPQKENMREVLNKSRSRMKRRGGEDQERTDGRNEIAETGEWRDDGASRKASSVRVRGWGGIGCGRREIKRERRQSWSRNENQDHVKDNEEMREGNHFVTKGQSSRGFETKVAEEREMLDDGPSKVNSQKRKGGGPPDRQSKEKKHHEYMSSYNHDTVEDGQKMGRSSYAEKEHRRHAHKNHL
ncbi:hypothetical protein REPUB_Repub18cG0038200 [Reevesia pubescens]